MKPAKTASRYYLGLIFLGAVARLLPHPPNFTPTGAIAFFSGSRLANAVMAYAVPLGILLVSDLFLGWHSGMFLVYGSFLISVALGRWLSGSAAQKAAGLILSSVNFFIVTNFGVWLGSGMYPATSQGLAACYIAAIPFFFNDLAATMLYGAAFFWLAAKVEKRLQPAGATA